MVKWVDGKIFKWGALVERKSDSGLIGVRRNQDNVVECGIIWHNSIQEVYRILNFKDLI